MSLPLLHTGSVKDIRGIKGQSPYIFEFSDRYSVFDWGAMPDTLDEKGKGLAAMARLFFDTFGSADFWKEWTLPPIVVEKYPLALKILEEVRANGVDHHCLGLVDSDGLAVRDGNFTNLLAVEPVNVLKPPFNDQTGKWDYKVYEDRPVKTLVPLEVIFRFGIPEGSSLLKRAKNESYLGTIGLDFEPMAGDEFDFPILEFSTKLESTDRYISLSAAQTISGMNDKEFSRIQGLCVLLSLRLKDMFEGIGIKLWDGKFEFAFSSELDENGDRGIQLVDSIGPDELRLTYKKTQLSKENLRQFYRDSEWHRNVEKAKELATARNKKDWKSICENELNSSPSPLSPKIKETITMMYKTLTDSLCLKYGNYTVFGESWDLDQLIERMEEL